MAGNRVVHLRIFPVPVSSRSGSFLIDSWVTENGLPDNFITSLIQTPDGYIWAGTYDGYGLARFDGAAL